MKDVGRALVPFSATLLLCTARVEAAPAARTGLQFDARTGLSVPFGKATAAADDDLSARYGKQLPISFGIGGKFSPAVYLGGYVGFSFGGAGSNAELQATCDSAGTQDCGATTARFGIETRYYFAPEEELNPWLAYGVGFEGSTFAIEREGIYQYTTLSGFELARVAVGLDWRASKVFGIGAYGEGSFGSFFSEYAEVDDRTTIDRDLAFALHGWATIGVRALFFP